MDPARLRHLLGASYGTIYSTSAAMFRHLPDATFGATYGASSSTGPTKFRRVQSDVPGATYAANFSTTWIALRI
eukprot:2043151-Pyramimonas_sp.AAC.1